jgi:hypothetical protein
MHARAIVARMIEPCLGGLHRKRSAALLRVTSALLCGGVSSLSGIALWLDSGTRFKHRIKCVDRMLGNRALHDQRDDLYREVAGVWLKDLTQVLVVIDWSDLSRDQCWQWLRASVVVQGRSLTLYEQVHPQARLGNPEVHRAFLSRLAGILPPQCRPIVLTDAGFHSPWFKAVAAQGWEFIGRVRGRNRVCLPDTQGWIPVRDLYGRAGPDARDLGLGDYARRNPVAVRAVLAKRPSKARHCLNMYGKRRAGRSNSKASRSALEPWLLVCSPSLKHLQAQAIVALYAQRMRIEQSFRDTRNLRWGMGLDVSRSRGRIRLEMLLLITHLASLVQRLIGQCARQQQQELQFMATRRADRHEVSVLTLARRMIDTQKLFFENQLPWQAIPPLRNQAALACQGFN